MMERFNFEAVEGKSNRVSLKRGEWVIDIYPMPGGYQNEYAPAKDFYKIQKRYHPNGMMSFCCKFLDDVSFGIMEYYNENGKLIKAIDEDAKFGKIKPDDLVAILEKLGWFNRETGENIIVESPLTTDGDFYRQLERNLRIFFAPAEYSKGGKETKAPFWVAYYEAFYRRYSCIVDGNTGEYKLEEYQIYVIP
jgi:hypothetical protein